MSQTQSRREDAALAVNENISLPSTAITAGIVHNIHRISIIGYLYRPDIQIKYVPKAIDSKGREGTGGPSPPIERSQIAGKIQVKSEPSLDETKKTTDRGEHRAAQKPSYVF